MSFLTYVGYDRKSPRSKNGDGYLLQRSVEMGGNSDDDLLQVAVFIIHECFRFWGRRHSLLSLCLSYLHHDRETGEMGRLRRTGPYSRDLPKAFAFANSRGNFTL